MLTTLLSIVLASAPAATPGDAPAALQALPATLDLGRLPAGSEASASVWLWNRSDAPLRLTSAKTTCGCVVVAGFEPVTLAAGEATPVSLSVSVPPVAGKEKAVTAVFAAEGAEPVRVPVRLVSAATAPPPSASEGPALRWKLAPGELSGAAGEEVTGSLWLLWDGAEERTALEVEPTCGCTRLAGVPDALVCRQPLEIPFRVTLPERGGAHRRTFEVSLGGSAPLLVPLRLNVRGNGA